MSTALEFDGTRFREVLAHLPTGVTIITSNTPEGPTGMAANSFTSVSLDPPLVLFCPAKSSSTWPLIREAGMFCVNVMAGHHRELVGQFARKGAERFAGVDYQSHEEGPVLTEAVAWLTCRIDTETDAGDHTIVVAEVTRLDAISDRDPLVFLRGRYGMFQESVAETKLT
ncbi:flavin reductase [Mycolicibacterium sp. P9-64]|uniref:flavin reductase family protein n=1 Tax=Mycolicibacterium sp. P9-64 TaxID=2024612 RepID=UPI0011EEFD31|nr:flavin reductase family protein [Mycolicibacterium sp. P9-64]KAA0078792.1 flavin reductase [Mycolicibacterium sp. P9-64]